MTCLLFTRVYVDTQQPKPPLSHLSPPRVGGSRYPSRGTLPSYDPETFLKASGTQTVVTRLTPGNVRREAKQSGLFLPDAKSGAVKNRSDIKTRSTCGRGTERRLLAEAVYSSKTMSVTELAQVIMAFLAVMSYCSLLWCGRSGLQMFVVPLR